MSLSTRRPWTSGSTSTPTSFPASATPATACLGRSSGLRRGAEFLLQFPEGDIGDLQRLANVRFAMRRRQEHVVPGMEIGAALGCLAGEPRRFFELWIVLEQQQRHLYGSRLADAHPVALGLRRKAVAEYLPHPLHRRDRFA